MRTLCSSQAARGREVDLRAQADRDRAQAEESERALRQTKWSCEDQIRIKEGRIQELTSESTELKKANTMMAEEYEQKMSELLGSLHEVEKAFVEQRAKHEEQQAKMQQAKEELMRNQRIKVRSSELRKSGVIFDTTRFSCYSSKPLSTTSRTSCPSQRPESRHSRLRWRMTAPISRGG